MSGEQLEELAKGKLKWGDVVDPTTTKWAASHGHNHGHLAFGSPDVDVRDVAEGKCYY